MKNVQENLQEEVLRLRKRVAELEKLNASFQANKSVKDIAVELEEKIEERTRQLNVINGQLQEKIAELEVFNKAAVGRELKIIALKDEIFRLQEKLSAK